MNMNLSSPKNSVCETPIAPKPRIPATLDEQEKRITALHEVINCLERKTVPIQRMTDPEPSSPCPPPKQPTTYYERIELHNDALEFAIHQIQKITGLLEI